MLVALRSAVALHIIIYSYFKDTLKVYISRLLSSQQKNGKELPAYLQEDIYYCIA